MKKLLCATALACAAILFCSIVIASEEVSSMSAADALKLLKEGNRRFVSSNSVYPNQTAARRDETSEKGQRPFAIVLSCADSRVPVELIFDRGIGDIFVVRVAGNIAGDSEIGSMDYAVEHFNVQLLVVMGHTKCGAVKAAVEGAHAQGKLGGIINMIAPAAQTVKKRSHGSEDDIMKEAIDENIVLAREDIMNGSPLIKRRVEEGRLKIVGVLYDIRTGEVRWGEPE